MNYSSKLFFILIGLTLFSCGNETIMIATGDSGFEYYPVEEGMTWIYQMDSIIITSSGDNMISSTSFRKETITNLFVTDQGDTSYVKQISRAENLTDEFLVTDVWRVEKTATQVLSFEENLGFLKMIFPITVGDSLNNLLFDQELRVNVGSQSMKPYREWRMKVNRKVQSMNVLNQSYSQLFHINQADYFNDLEYRKVDEFYAPGIGLVSREMSILDDQCGTPGRPCDDTVPWIDRATRGFVLTQQLVEFR